MNVKFFRLIDKSFISFITLPIFSSKKITYQNKNILLIKLWALGDSVLSLPLLENIKKNFPDSNIDILVHTRNKNVYEENRNIRKLILFNMPNLIKLFRKYDLVFDLEPYLNLSALISFWSGKFRIGFSHNLRSKLYNKTILFNRKQHMVQNYLDMLRILNKKCNSEILTKIKCKKSDENYINELLKKNNVNKTDFVIGICPGVAESVKSRMWPLENFAKLADKLIKEKKSKIIFIDGPSNKKITNEIQQLMTQESINLVGKTNVSQLITLIERCNFFISNDTGPLHIAAAQEVKTTGLFGPNTPLLWAPYGKNNSSIYHKTWCSPCIDNAQGKMPKCFNKEYQKCMNLITIEEVFNTIKKKK